MRVTNWQRWTRTKGIAAFILFLAAIIAGGGLEDPDATRPSNYPLAICFLAGCAYLMHSIYRRR